MNQTLLLAPPILFVIYASDLIVSLTKIISEVAFSLVVKSVKRIRGCVTNFILFVVYYLSNRKSLFTRFCNPVDSLANTWKNSLQTRKMLRFASYFIQDRRCSSHVATCWRKKSNFQRFMVLYKICYVRC